MNLLIWIHLLPFILLALAMCVVVFIDLTEDHLSLGTRSVLYGYHQFLIHPLFVAWGWWKLYGFPLDPRLWVAFFVHDLGYIGSANMDGDEGEKHPWLGARLMGDLFDYRDQFGHRWPLASWYTKLLGRPLDFVFGHCPQGQTWYCFTFYHSRFLCRTYGEEPSKLCYADKMAIIITPTWLQLPLMNCTGEIHEYMEGKEGRTAGDGKTQRQWVEDMKDVVRGFISEKLDRCIACGESCPNRQWMCDEARDFRVWCPECFGKTACGTGAHGEGCPTYCCDQ